MKVPAIFKGKLCKCGNEIGDHSAKEIGVDFNTEQFLLRFTCSKCGFNGRLIFKTDNKKVEDLCKEIISMTESSIGNEEIEEMEAPKKPRKSKNDEKAFSKIKRKKGRKTIAQMFCTDFDQNAIGCLFIPECTDDLINEYEKDCVRL
jgi:hypothetical protein